MERARASITERLEQLAADLVAENLGGESVRRDLRGPGAQRRTHDFDVNLSTGRVIALEVTTAAVERAVETSAATRKLAAARFPSLTHHWGLTARHPSEEERGPQIKMLAKHADVLLHRLEVAGVSCFDTENPGSAPAIEDPDALAAAQTLAEFGVFAGRQFLPVGAGESASVPLSLVSSVIVDNEDLNGAVSREALANLAKLEEATADGRHLFVWVDPSLSGPELAMFTGNVPPVAPKLPASIETVWAGTLENGPDGLKAQRLWRISPPASWEVLLGPDLLRVGP
jgi:hypothetical protein